MRKCMGWMRPSISTIRWSCDARTSGDVLFLGGSRWSDLGYFSMTWMNGTMLLQISRNELPTGSRNLRLKQLFSGLGEVVQ
jgi:hypothetical protein